MCTSSPSPPSGRSGSSSLNKHSSSRLAKNRPRPLESSVLYITSTNNPASVWHCLPFFDRSADHVKLETNFDVGMFSARCRDSTGQNQLDELLSAVFI